MGGMEEIFGNECKDQADKKRNDDPFHEVTIISRSNIFNWSFSPITSAASPASKTNVGGGLIIF
jgi:hypothetical protein